MAIIPLYLRQVRTQCRWAHDHLNFVLVTLTVMSLVLLKKCLHIRGYDPLNRVRLCQHAQFLMRLQICCLCCNCRGSVHDERDQAVLDRGWRGKAQRPSGVHNSRERQAACERQHCRCCHCRKPAYQVLFIYIYFPNPNILLWLQILLPPLLFLCK